jgi:hypothetical protein
MYKLIVKKVKKYHQELISFFAMDSNGILLQLLYLDTLNLVSAVLGRFLTKNKKMEKISNLKLVYIVESIYIRSHVLSLNLIIRLFFS